jgi:hypothetical protein
MINNIDTWDQFYKTPLRAKLFRTNLNPYIIKSRRKILIWLLWSIMCIVLEELKGHKSNTYKLKYEPLCP